MTKASKCLARADFSGIFEDFMLYCEEDNEQLSADIKTWLADYFDVASRGMPMEPEEDMWIKRNLSPQMQKRIFGKRMV